MKFNQTSYTTQKEILKRKLGGEYLVPITLDFTSVVADADGNFVVKAGSPISAAGVVDNLTAPIGILLSDVYKDNPNGTILKAFGAVNLANAEANSGLTIAAAVKTALSNIYFE